MSRVPRRDQIKLTKRGLPRRRHIITLDLLNVMRKMVLQNKKTIEILPVIVLSKTTVYDWVYIISDKIKKDQKAGLEYKSTDFSDLLEKLSQKYDEDLDLRDITDQIIVEDYTLTNEGIFEKAKVLNSKCTFSKVKYLVN